jgi:Cu(I)/Ag(I) efflux system membrane fusion protein
MNARMAAALSLAAVAGLGGAFILGNLVGPKLFGHSGSMAMLQPLNRAMATTTMTEPATEAMTKAGDAMPSASGGAQHKILYYRNPMGLPDVSQSPKKDSMGMDYIPVYEGEEPDDGSTVKVSLEKVQRLGVVTAPAQSRDRFMRTINAVGTIALDERRMAAVTTKVEGWVERLHLNTTGQAIQRGAPMLEIYSPDLLLAQQEYLVAVHRLEAAKAANATDEIAAATRLVEGAAQRLKYWDISDDQIEQLRRRGTVQRRLVLHAPVSGQVMEKKIIEGMRIMPGEPLFELADLSTVWVIAEVFEQDLGLIKPGQRVQISVAAYPGETFAGTVDFIYPEVDPDTRRGKVRVEIANPDGRLKEHMYASLAFSATAVAGQVVTVPESALLDSGKHQVVLVEKGEGRYEPREVKTGARGDGLVEITEGLKAGEPVVVRANFLIDAESNLQAALHAFVAPNAPSATHNGASGAAASK